MNFHFSTVPSLSVTSEDQLRFGRGENDCHDFENEGHYALERSLEAQVGPVVERVVNVYVLHLSM